MKALNIFNHYLDKGGEAHAVDMVVDSLSRLFSVERCDFFSAEWTSQAAPPIWQQALKTFYNPQSLRVLRELQSRLSPDFWLVHNVFPVGSAAVYREATSLGVPIIQYLHNFRPFSASGDLWTGKRVAPGGLKGNFWEEIRHGTWRDSRVKTAWLAFVLSGLHALDWCKSVRAWIAISDFLRDKFITAGIAPEKIFTLRHFWRPQSHATLDEQHFLYLGRLNEAKGVNVVLDAWELMEKERPGRAPTLVVAGNGPLRSVVAERAERLKSVRYVGEISNAEKEKALGLAKAVIVPSLWWEPLGLVVYEAYDHTKPVLAAASGGLPEIIVPNSTGILHKPGDAATLAQNVLELESNPVLRRAMGAEGRNWLVKNANEAAWQEKFSAIAAHAVNGAVRPHSENRSSSGRCL